MPNPLLADFLLPTFSTIQPEHITSATQQIIAENKEKITLLTEQKIEPTWDSFCQPICELEEKLQRIVSVVTHLHAVKNTPELRQAYEKCLPLLSEFSTWSSQHRGLHTAWKVVKDREDFGMLSAGQRKRVENTLRDFYLTGINLPFQKQQRLGEISARLALLASKFSLNVLDATMSWRKHITDENELSGLPENIIQSAKQQAVKLQLEGWILLLDNPVYQAVMTCSDNAILRKDYYFGMLTRASDQSHSLQNYDNSPVMEEIILLRQEQAAILGMASFAELSLTKKMAASPAQVISFLSSLAEKSKPYAIKEVAALQKFTQEKYGVSKLEVWDIPYYGEKQKQHEFAISDELLRSYFPEEKVLTGLFKLIEKVFSINVLERKDIDVWHQDVRYFELYNQDNEICGSFYLDLYARENKQGGAWMDTCAGRMRKADGTLQKPIAYLVCNFTPPVQGRSVLLTHGEVETLFHEMGHGLHHMLTQVETSGVAGVEGVAWDAVELPSQFMENWCWQPDVLAWISSHCDSGDPLPADILQRMLAAKNYQSGLFILRQVEMGLFDFCLHNDDFSPGEDGVMSCFLNIKNQVSIFDTPKWARFPHGFSHIFTGGYAAGYYSYLWADVLAADAWSRFEAEGIFNPLAGSDFRDIILAGGGVEDPQMLFRQFRGRAPDPDALLKQYNIISIS